MPLAVVPALASGKEAAPTEPESAGHVISGKASTVGNTTESKPIVRTDAGARDSAPHGVGARSLGRARKGRNAGTGRLDARVREREVGVILEDRLAAAHYRQ